MDQVFEKLRILGGMRVVTANTIHHGCLYADVRLGKGRLGGFVALFARYGQFRCKQYRIRCIMRIMAVQAVLLRRVMLLLLVHFFLDILVAGVTEAGSLGYEQIFQLGLVRVMAHGTVPFTERRMFGNGLLEPLVRLVATGTDLDLWFHQHSGGIAAVRIVAGHAFTTLERFMV